MYQHTLVYVHTLSHVYIYTSIHVYITSFTAFALIFRTLPCLDSYWDMPCRIIYSMNARMVKPSLWAIA